MLAVFVSWAAGVEMASYVRRHHVIGEWFAPSRLTNFFSVRALSRTPLATSEMVVASASGVSSMATGGVLSAVSA